MVRKIIINNKNAYQCGECKFKYKNKRIATKCEEYCKKYKACNSDIIKHALNINSERRKK